MTKDQITFIIPSINRNSINDSINSLLKQTNPNWKCIIIYDGVDGKEFEDERIKKIVVEKKGGYSGVHGMSGLVRNEGLKLVDTNWIGFLDDDDTLDPNYVDTLFKKYNNYDLVVWRMRYLGGNILPLYSNPGLFFGNVGISISYKNKFDNLLFDGNRDGEDFDFIMKINNLTNNLIVASEAFYKVGH